MYFNHEDQTAKSRHRSLQYVDTGAIDVNTFQAKIGKFATSLFYTIKNSICSAPKQVFFFLRSRVNGPVMKYP